MFIDLFPVGPWDDLHQLVLGFFRGPGVDKRNEVGYPVNMSVNRDGVPVKAVDKNTVRCLSSHTWQGKDLIEILWNFPIMPFDQGLTYLEELNTSYTVSFDK